MKIAQEWSFFSKPNKLELLVFFDSVILSWGYKIIFLQDVVYCRRISTILALILSDRMCLVPILRYSEFFLDLPLLELELNYYYSQGSTACAPILYQIIGGKCGDGA